MIHNDPTALPIFLFIVSLAASAVATTGGDSAAAVAALCALAAVAGVLACVLTARTRAARGIAASLILLLGIAAAVAFSSWRPAGADMFFFATMFPAFATAVPIFTACCACVLAAGMETRKVFLALCAAIAVMVLPRFVVLLFGGLSLLAGSEWLALVASAWFAPAVTIAVTAAIFSLFAYVAKNHELVPGGGGGGVSGGSISPDWSSF